MLENKSTSSTPQLARPGAGIPWYQKLFLRFYIGPFLAAKSDWSVSEQSFHKISGRILKEIEGLTEKQLSTRVLVPPQRGLEDSSRFWSISMTLEHLVIVGEEMMIGILELTCNRQPPTQVDIAKVKPLGLMSTLESLEEFKLFISTDYRKFVLSLKDRNSKLTHLHPWFGLFTAKQWFWLLAIHQGLHLQQIREIKKRLPIVD